jgi:hypothetical protein
MTPVNFKQLSVSVIYVVARLKDAEKVRDILDRLGVRTNLIEVVTDQSTRPHRRRIYFF